jgi:hypothetical protein
MFSKTTSTRYGALGANVTISEVRDFVFAYQWPASKFPSNVTAAANSIHLRLSTCIRASAILLQGYFQNVSIPTDLTSFSFTHYIFIFKQPGKKFGGHKWRKYSAFLLSLPWTPQLLWDIRRMPYFCSIILAYSAEWRKERLCTVIYVVNLAKNKERN